MGFDKQFLEVNEKRLMSIIIEKLSIKFDEIIIVTNKPESYLNFSHKITKDIIVGKGPLSGIHVGLIEAKSQYVYFTACDMPNINIDYIKYMKEEIRELDVQACVAKSGEFIEPFNAFYSRYIVEDIEDYLLQGRRSVKFLLDNLKVHYIGEEKARKYSPNWDMFLNLNTEEDLKSLM